MTRFLNTAETASTLLTKALEPVDLEGGHYVPSILTRSIQDVKNYVDTGPPFTLSDVVRTPPSSCQ